MRSFRAAARQANAFMTKSLTQGEDTISKTAKAVALLLMLLVGQRRRASSSSVVFGARPPGRASISNGSAVVFVSGTASRSGSSIPSRSMCRRSGTATTP